VSLFSGILIIYLASLFLLNFYYDEIRSVLNKEVYYFIYTSIEYLSLAFIIKKFINSEKLKKIILVFSIVFVIFLLVFYSISTIKRVDSIPIGVETILLFTYILFFFQQYFKNMYSNIYENASFWFIVGILIYLGITFFFNILANNLERDFVTKYFFYSYLGDIMKNMLFAIAIFQYSKQHPDSDRNGNSSKVPYLDMI
jgi:hypothetical protein